MKRMIGEFIRRGSTACCLGPIILGIFYLIMQDRADLHTLTVNQVCIGIFSVSALAFIAGGMNAIYQIEQLPLMVAVLIHGLVLYASYLGAYLINGWLELGMAPILVFSGIFVVGYLIIWGIIYSIIKKNADRLNIKLKQKQQSSNAP